MPAPFPLDDAASVILDAAGNGTVKIGPRSLGQVWQVTNLAILTGSAVLTPVARLYRGSVAAPNLLGGSYSGDQDSIPLDVTLTPGGFLSVRWTGGDVGTRATVSVYGTVKPSR